MAKAQKILGLAFEEDRILAADVQMRGDQPHLHATAEFALGQELSTANSSEQGQQLRQFLKDNGLSTKTAVVGLPAKWLVAKELTIPPTSASSLSGILSIQAERAFSLDTRELAFDYYGAFDAARGSTLLLVAMQRRRLNQIQSLTKAAGLSVTAITPTSHALRSISGDHGSDLSLYIRDGYIESWSGKGELPLIRHGSSFGTQASDERIKALQEQMIRLLSVAPGSTTGSGASHITLFTGSRSNGEFIEQISGSLSDQVEISDGDARLLSAGFGAERTIDVGSGGAAAALVLAGIKEKGLYVDFLHSRMVPGRRLPQKRTIVWAAILSFAALVVLTTTIWDWRRDVNDIATFSRQLSVMGDDIKAAREVVERMSYASAWTSREPEFLECLSQLTGAFPERGTIWATNLALRQNKQGLVTGKSLREDYVLDVLDAIKLNKVFRNVQMVYMRDAGRGTNEVSFAIAFTFSGGG